MRDPARIRPIVERLVVAWSQVPDWRLGQLLSNAVGGDPFYVEDERLIRKIEEVVRDTSTGT